ncbi:TonB-dependent receptor [Hyphomonas johnsonii]|uniref:TonB-dependent receptor n=1 Tax=Hyphomonas johnsonii MHS-2 TaxID=1280950 RepID=A0A059FU57_9PROT|nr:TonB-dependent receptor [Hyphomonas johnsonii]KCZ94209.1 TonB-dependent receptor [Hyphomonas johnsonii MHS-2]
MSFFKSLLVGSSLASLALAIPAYAQVAETAQDAQQDGGAQKPDAEARLGKVVVTAQKREQDAQDVPIAVSTLDEDLLDLQQFSDVTALSSISPSVNFQGGFTPSATNFSIRGVGSYAFTGGVQPSVSLVVDGVPYARAGEFVTDLADVQQVEILRGPQGTLFGRNSTGGAINITRKRPTDEFEGEIEAGISSDEEYLIRGVVSGPLADNVSGRLAGVYIDREGFIENSGPAFSGGDLGGIETFAFSGKLDIDFSPDFNVLLSGDYSNREHGYSPQIGSVGEVIRGIGPGGTDLDVTGGARALALGGGDAQRGQAILNDPLKTAISLRGDSNENIAWGGSIDATYDFNDNITLKSITALRHFTDDNGPDVDGTPADGDNLIMPIVSVNISSGKTITRNGGNYAPSRSVESDYFIQELRLQGTYDAFEWIVGGFYQDYEEDLLNTTPLLIIDSFNPAFGNGANVGGTATPNDEYVLSANTQDNNYGIDTYAIFGDMTFHLTDQLDVFGGLRWTREEVSKDLNNQTFFSVFTFADIASRFDSTKRILDTDDLVPSDLVVGKAKASEEFVSYRAGASYHLSDAVSVYGSVSRGQVGLAAPISYTDDLSFLEPTVADNYEIGLKSELFDRRVRFNTAIFQTDVTDLQASALIPGTVNTTTINAGNIDIMGAETDITAVVNENLTFGLSVVYLDSEIKDLLQSCFFDQLSVNNALTPNCNIDTNNDGTPETQDVSGYRSTNTPEWAFNTYASFTIPTQSLPFDFYGLVNYSWKDDVQFTLNQDDLARQKAYGLLDLTFGLKDKSERYEVFVYGKNVLDQTYVSDAFEAFGALGRRVVRANRNAQAYYGAGFKYTF